jgi:hemerythrin superfamily protein
MNAIEFLIKEHDKVRNTLTDIEDKSHRFETKLKMFEALSNELIRHETMEHKVWYPHFKNDSRLSSAVKHLLKEENDAEKAIKKLHNIQNQDEWEEKFTKFKDDVKHHAKEEETKLFPEVKKILDETQLQKIGAEMREFKENYTQSHQ